MTTIIFELHSISFTKRWFGLKNTKSINCKTKTEWTWLFRSPWRCCNYAFVCLFFVVVSFCDKSSNNHWCLFFSTGNSPTKPSDESSRINSKASDPCSWFGQSGLRLMFLLAKANRFLIRVIISNLRNGISWNILSGLLSVVKVWNLKNDFRYNAACFVSGDLSQLSVHFLYICSTRLKLYDPLMRPLLFCCFVLRFYKMQLGLDSLIWKVTLWESSALM